MPLGKVEAPTMVIHSSGFLKRSTTRRRCSVPKRFIISILMGIGMFIMYWMRLNFSVSIIEILIKDSYSDTLFPKESSWTTGDILMMDSAFYWGSAAGQIPGALLVIAWSAHKSLIASIALTSLLHMALPLALNYHMVAFIVLNIMQGLTVGPLHSSCIGILLQWTPPTEKARLLSIVLSGAPLGFLLGGLLSGFLVENLGEEIGFFSASMGGLLWCCIWSAYTFPSPSEDPLITQKELSFLEEHIDTEIKSPPTLKSIPFKSILTSRPVYGICIASFCFICSEYAMRWVPFFYINRDSSSSNGHEILHFCAPKLIMVFSVLLAGFLSDFIINRGILKTKTTRLLITCVGFGMYGSLLVIVQLLNNDTAAIVLLHLSNLFLGLTFGGYAVNCLDICPRYACIVVGCYNTISAIGGIVFPIIIDHVANIFVESWHWKVILSATSAISLVAAVVYGVLVSGERQEWDRALCDADSPKSDNDATCYPPNDTEEGDGLIEDITIQ